jgi:hypothetical protein
MGRYRTQADYATSATQPDCYSVGSSHANRLIT